MNESTLSPFQAVTIRHKIRGAYEERINELKAIRARHVERLIDGGSDLTRVNLLRTLIRDIDTQVKNHEQMRVVILAEIEVPE
jgi:hypothetical protein